MSESELDSQALLRGRALFRPRLWHRAQSCFLRSPPRPVCYIHFYILSLPGPFCNSNSLQQKHCELLERRVLSSTPLSPKFRLASFLCNPTLGQLSLFEKGFPPHVALSSEHPNAAPRRLFPNLSDPLPTVRGTLNPIANPYFHRVCNGTDWSQRLTAVDFVLPTRHDLPIRPRQVIFSKASHPTLPSPWSPQTTTRASACWAKLCRI